MNKKISVVALSVLFIIGFSCCFANGSVQSALELIPENATVLMSVGDLKKDPGLSYIMQLWKTQLDEKTKSASNRILIDEVYRLTPPELMGAIVMKNNSSQYLLVIKFEGMSQEKKQMDVFKKMLDTFFARRKRELKTINFMGQKIIYAAEKDPSRLSSYVIIGDYVAISSNKDLLKEVVKVSRGEASSITKNKNLTEEFFKSTERDLKIYIDNSNGEIAKNIKKWEQEHYFVFLLSMDYLEGFKITLDIVNEDKLTGQLLFLTQKQKESVFDDISDDIFFFDNAMKRKCIKDGYDYRSSLKTESGQYSLNFEISGLKKLWVPLFSRSKKSIFDSKSEDAVVAPGPGIGEKIVKIKEFYLPSGIIFVVTLLIFLFLTKRRKK